VQNNDLMPHYVPKAEVNLREHNAKVPNKGYG